MIIASLRYTVNSYKAVQGCKHIVKPGFVIGKPEYDKWRQYNDECIGGSTGD